MRSNDIIASNIEMDITYKINNPISADQFIELLVVSSLAERRPVDDRDCIEGMVNNSNLLITAWHDNALIGIARSMTDFHYACYLSDLAVDKNYQGNNIGRELLRITQQQLGAKCKLLLIAAPAANAYYEHIGFTNNQRCWVLDCDQSING